MEKPNKFSGQPNTWSIYFYIYIYIYIYIYKHHIYIPYVVWWCHGQADCVCICVHTYIYIHTHILIYIHTSQYLHIYIAYIYMHIYAYTHTHTHTHTYTHTHTPVLRTQMTFSVPEITTQYVLPRNRSVSLPVTSPCQESDVPWAVSSATGVLWGWPLSGTYPLITWPESQGKEILVMDQRRIILGQVGIPQPWPQAFPFVPLRIPGGAPDGMAKLCDLVILPETCRWHMRMVVQSEVLEWAWGWTLSGLGSAVTRCKILNKTGFLTGKMKLLICVIWENNTMCN